MTGSDRTVTPSTNATTPFVWASCQWRGPRRRWRQPAGLGASTQGLRTPAYVAYNKDLTRRGPRLSCLAMSAASSRIRLRQLLTGDYTCTWVAPIFDTISARIAESMGWEVCKLSSSTLKAVNFGLPDQVKNVTNTGDFADVVRRIRRVAPSISLAIDIDDAGGTRLAVWRTVRELEAAGITSLEIEDRVYGERLESMSNSENTVFHSVEEQVALYKTALDAREDPNTVIIARTASYADLQNPSPLPRDAALERIRAYAATGVDGFYLPGEPQHIRADIEAVHSVTDLPLLVLRMPADVYKDEAFLRRNNVRLRYLGQPVLHMATRAIYDSLKSLQDGGTGTDKTGDLDMAYWPGVERGERTEGGGPMLNLLGRYAEFQEIDQRYP